MKKLLFGLLLLGLTPTVSFGAEGGPAATQERIIPPQEIRLNDDQKAKECSICLINYQEDQRAVQLSCNHIFHTTCIEQLRRSDAHNWCPLCRRPFAEDGRRQQEGLTAYDIFRIMTRFIAYTPNIRELRRVNRDDLVVQRAQEAREVQERMRLNALSAQRMQRAISAGRIGERRPNFLNQLSIPHNNDCTLL